VCYLTQPKMIEIENLLETNDNINVYCLVETHQTRNSIKTRESTKYLSKMRNISDKKGGGLLIIWKDENLMFEEIIFQNPDILAVNININKQHFILILVYVASNDDKRNILIYKDLEKLYDKYKDEKLLFLGDFNGHIEILGNQKINQNGKKLMSFIDRFNLYILNLDQNCSGEITWKRNEMESVIDFAITNSKMY